MNLTQMTIISDFPGGSDGKASAYNVEDLGSVPGLGRSPGEGNGNPLQNSCLENSMDRGAWWATVHGVAKSQTQRVTAWSPSVFFADSKLHRCRAVSFLFSIVSPGDQWRNNSRKKEEMEPKQRQYSVVDVTGDGSRVRCCKEQYCIGTWNIKPMNQGKLEVVKQEMARVNIDILGISGLIMDGNG